MVPALDGDRAWQSMLIWGREFLGWNLRWVVGYGGTNDMIRAFETGEADIYATNSAYVLERLIYEEKIAVPITQAGKLGEGGTLVRRPDFPDVPTFPELLKEKGKLPTGTPWAAYEAWIGASMVDKFQAAPPGTPDNIMNILREGWRQMSQDPEFDALVKRVFSPVYSVSIGNAIMPTIKQVLDAPPEVIQYMLDLKGRSPGMPAK